MAKKSAEALPTKEAIQNEPRVVRANINRKVEVSEEYVSLYANDMQLQMTPWDLRLVVGQISSTPSTEDPTMVVRQIGDVRMSPQLAKKVALLLLGQIEHYERTIGPIHLPED